LSIALSKIAYGNGSAFKSLIGMKSVAGRNTIRATVLEVKTGLEALPLIPHVGYAEIVKDPRLVTFDGLRYRPPPVRPSPNRVVLPQSKMLQLAIFKPLVAVRLSIEPSNSSVDLATIRDRQFTLMGHSDRPAPSVVKTVFGKLSPIDPHRLMPISKEKVDIDVLETSSDFWVLFLGVPLSWRSNDECGLTIDFTVANNHAISVRDDVALWSKAKDNLSEAVTDAFASATTYERLTDNHANAIGNNRLEITSPMECRVVRGYPGRMVVHLLGNSDKQLVLLYNNKALTAVDDGKNVPLNRIASASNIKWPSESVQIVLGRQREGGRILIKGTVMFIQQGVPFILPNWCLSLE
jgi:hypothetical protein